MNIKPIIAISAGDPAGIGPEVTVKSLAMKSVYQICKPLVVCDAQIIEQALKFCNLTMKINRVDNPDQGYFTFGTIDVYDLRNIEMNNFYYNKVTKMTGQAAFEYVRKVIELAVDSKVDATVTGPINKEAIHLAGYPWSGHTEIFAHYTGTKDYTMMLVEKDFRVVHVSTHVSMLESINRLSQDRIFNVIKLTDNALRQMGIPSPRIAVNGINPHAGENGLFGTEEIQHIIPAINKAKAHGINVYGPEPADTVFPRMRGGQFDVVVCMYHDQGHIPTKLLGFTYNERSEKWEGVSGVNITLGLPIIRTSVDHGTAFDKGGKGEANPESMTQAITQATRLSKQKK